MKKIEDKREDEKQLIGEMIGLYCRKHHNTKHELCEQCQELMEYACMRIDKCPFMETKSFCSKCKVHCYKSDMRKEVKKVMRYSGPRLIWTHPILTIKHLLAK